MRTTTIHCDGCGKDITLTPLQHISLGQSRERDLCMPCYNHILHKLSEIDRDIHFEEKGDKYSPERCIDCPNFIDSPVVKIENDLAATFGSCTKAMKNFTCVDPCNQTPSWCPLKGEE